MATHLPRSTLANLGMTERSQLKTHALYTTFLLQGKLTTALVDSGSSISLISWSYLQTLTFSGKTEEYDGKILTAKNSPLLIKGKIEMIVMLEKFTPKFRATFLISALDFFPCLLGLDFMVQNDCVLYAKQQKLFCGKINRSMELKSNASKEGSTFLAAKSNQAIPARTETLVQCELRYEDGSKATKLEGIVNPLETFQEATGLWVAHALVNDDNRTCWVGLLNIHNEDIVTYRDTRVDTLETLELDEQSLKLQRQTEEKTKREDFSFERHVNIENKNLSKDQLHQVRTLCNKYETIFSRHSNDLGFNNQIEHQIKLKPDAKPFRRTYGNTSFDKRKAMKKIVEGLAEADLIAPTQSDWAAPSILVPKKDGSFRLVVDYRGLNKQIEKTCWPLPRISDVIDSLEGNMFFFRALI